MVQFTERFSRIQMSVPPFLEQDMHHEADRLLMVYRGIDHVIL